MRRKHGIPDGDHRPFNVAYAAVQRARQERETLRSAKFKPMNNVPREQSRPSAQPNQDLRQRTGMIIDYHFIVNRLYRDLLFNRHRQERGNSVDE